MPSLCDELTFVVDKGDEDRIRGMFFDKLYEKWQELKKKRGLPDRAIKVMPEDEYRRQKVDGESAWYYETFSSGGEMPSCRHGLCIWN